jgi:hypothetical protein
VPVVNAVLAVHHIAGKHFMCSRLFRRRIELLLLCMRLHIIAIVCNDDGSSAPVISMHHHIDVTLHSVDLCFLASSVQSLCVRI